MSQLKEILQHTVNFVEKHSPEAERLSDLKDLIPEFSGDSDSVTKRAKKLAASKSMWDLLHTFSMILMVVLFFSGIFLLAAYSFADDPQLIQPIIITMLVVLGFCVSTALVREAERQLALEKSLAIFGKEMVGTEGCIELLSLKKESAQISDYIRQVTLHRELFTYDLALCNAMAQAAKNAAQQEILKEEIRLACAQLHGA